MAPRVLTRRELHDLVWSKPLRDVAAELGISDVGLAKACKRHEVPRPEQGYWNKIHAGKPVKKAAFVEVDDARADRIELGGSLSQLPAEARVEIEGKRAQAKALAPISSVPPRAAATELQKSVEPTIRALRKSKPDATGALRTSGAGLCSVEVAPASVERIASILADLAGALEARGLSIKPTDTGVAIPRGKDLVLFSIREKTRRQTHEPTQAEIDAEARRQRKRQQYFSGARRDLEMSGLFDRTYPEFDIVHTGALVLELEGYDRGMRRSGADGKSQAVEKLIDSIVTGIDAILTLRRVEREQREERERRWNELCRRRDLATKRKEPERQRLDYWRQLTRTQREIDLLRRWIRENQISEGEVAADSVLRMLGWARARLGALEDNVSLENVDRLLKSRNLFPEVDDLLDPLGEPPDQPQYAWQL